MLRLSILLMLGAAPLYAQAGHEDADKMNPPTTPTVGPAQPPGNAVMTPGVNAPPPGTAPPPPMLPAEPIVAPRITQFVVTPDTVREGLTGKDAVKAIVTLSAPATKDLHCHVMSTAPLEVVCGDIVVPKGQQQQDGAVSVVWAKVPHNGQVQIKAYDEDNPETLLHARIYLRKKIE